MKDSGELPANADTIPEDNNISKTYNKASHCITPALGAVAIRTVRFNERYVSSITAALEAENERNLIIRSDMNTGKTHAVSELLKAQHPDHISVVVIATESLCRAVASSYKGKGVDAIDYKKAQESSRRPALIVTTFNSLPKIEKMIGDQRLNMLAIDEVEQGASFMATGTIKNKSEAACSIGRLSARAGRVWLMDAHVRGNTAHFVKAFMPGVAFTYVVNEFQSWAGWTASVHEGKETAIDLAADKLSKGKRIIVTSSSARQVGAMHKGLEALGRLDGLRVLTAYSSDTEDESEELKATKENSELFKQYDVVFCSPKTGVGISIEGEHFHSVIATCVQDKDTPDAVSTLQYPFRARNLIDKHVDFVHVDQSMRDGGLDSVETNNRDFRRMKILREQIINSAATDKEQAGMLANLSAMHLTYELEINNQRSTDFDSYRQIIEDEVKAKGITLVAAEDAPEDGDARAAVKELKLMEDDKIKAAVISARTIDDEEADRLTALKRAGKQITKIEQFELRRYRLVTSYHFDNDGPTDEQIGEYFEMQSAGIATGRNNAARALLSRKDVNSLLKAYVNGVGEGQSYQLDAADNRPAELLARWRLDRILIRVVGLERIGDVCSMPPQGRVTDDWLLSKGSWNSAGSIVAELGKVAGDYNATKPGKRVNLKALQGSPASAVRGLIEDRLKIDTKKVRGENAFTVEPEQQVVDNLNSQLARGSFGELKALDKIHALQILTKGSDVSETLRDELELSNDDFKFLRERLPTLPRRRQISAIAKYLKLALTPRSIGDRLAPIAYANLSILDACEAA